MGVVKSILKKKEEEKKVLYRAPAALCCWLFDVDILPLILPCIASFFKEASVQARGIFTFCYMFQPAALSSLSGFYKTTQL